MSENALGADPALAEEPALITEVPEGQLEVKTDAEPAPAKETPEDKVQKRFDKLTKEKYDAQRRGDRLEWQLQQLQSQPAKTESVAPIIPTLESSGFDDSKYQKALGEYNESLIESKVEALLAKRQAQTQEVSKASEFDKRQAEFAKSKPDYAEKVIENPSLPISQTMAEVIRESEIGPQIAYHLADHPEIAESIARLSPLAQAREIGRIEAKLEVQKAAPAKVSQAPAPAAKIEASEPDVSKDPKDMNPAQFAKWRRKYMK